MFTKNEAERIIARMKSGHCRRTYATTGKTTRDGHQQEISPWSNRAAMWCIWGACMAEDIEYVGRFDCKERDDAMAVNDMFGLDGAIKWVERHTGG